MKFAPLALTAAIAGILGFAPGSFAQSPDRDVRDHRSDRGSGRGDNDWRNDRAPLDDRDRDSRRGKHAESDREDGQLGQDRGRHHTGEMGDHMGQMGRMAGGQMQRGARFRIESGDARIDIQCPAQIEVDRCVQAAEQLFDRLGRRADGPQSVPGTSGSGSPLQTPPGTPTPGR